MICKNQHNDAFLETDFCISKLHIPLFCSDINAPVQMVFELQAREAIEAADRLNLYAFLW